MNLSTSSRVVYMRKHYVDEYPSYGGMTMHGMTLTKTLHRYEYIAISRDKSSIITWSEKPNNYEGKTSSRTYYSRVPEEEFLPKSVNYDFLND